MNWSISYSHFAGDSREFEADTSRDVCNELQRMADSKHVGKLEFDDFTDEVHAFFRRKGKRIRFMNAQAG